jgi:AraC family transcriptional regulator, regulatory protein of adaptative response / methylphosphotriester-DNA alkyltransferase methyltransferase
MTVEEKWKAVSNNDENYDGIFFYAVKSTGIFCRPSCKSKLPLRDNVSFYENGQDARKAGYRPCKRCRPDLLEYNPVKDIAKQSRKIIKQYFHTRDKLELEIKKLGVSDHRIAEIFKEEYGITFLEYMNSLRLDQVKKKLQNMDDDIVTIAYEVGFESLSAFYRFFRKYTGTSPAKYRKELMDKEDN